MRFLFGSYSLTLPFGVEVQAKATHGAGGGNTLWTIPLGAFSFYISLDPHGTPRDLKTFVLTCTKQDVEPEGIEINGISGVVFGDLAVDRRVEWWMKKGELMIRISLEGPSIRTQEQEALHNELVSSLRYVP